MRVTVCIPTVNRPELLRDCLASVARQTFHDFEVIVSDNSGDPQYGKTVEDIVQGFAPLQVTVVHQPKMLPMTAHANVLTQLGCGDYWCFLPDDDRFCPDYLACLAAALDAHPEVGFAFSDHWLISADGSVDIAATDENTVFWGRDQLHDGVIHHARLLELVVRQSITVQSTLFRSEVIRAFGFDSRVSSIPDLDLPFRIACSRRVTHGHYSGRRLMEYRIHGAQATGSLRARDIHLEMIRLLEQLPRVPASVRSGYRHKLSNHYSALAVQEALSGSRWAALSAGLTGVRHQPSLRSLGVALVVAALPRSIVALVRDHWQVLARRVIAARLWRPDGP